MNSLSLNENLTENLVSITRWKTFTPIKTGINKTFTTLVNDVVILNLLVTIQKYSIRNPFH